MTATARVVVERQTLVLLPERAAFWEEQRTLLVADTHFGKAATFRAAGVPVPGGTTLSGLSRLDRAAQATAARRIVFLGDFLHAREGRVAGTLAALAKWRRSRPELDLLLVRGNHDRRAGDPPEELDVTCADAPYDEGPFTLAHHPVEGGRRFMLAGHLHPAVRLSGRGRERARLPCFWFRGDGAVLPAFGDFTGMAEVEPGIGDRVFVIAGGDVVEVGGARGGLPPKRP